MECRIHDSINYDKSSRFWSGKAASDHHTTTTMFDLVWCSFYEMRCWFYARCNGTHTPSKSSTFVTSVHKIFSQKSWKKIKLFFGKCEMSLCFLFGLQWLLPRNFSMDAVFAQSLAYCWIMNTRGAMDRRWSVLRTDQSPQFGTHVISGLTDTFIHHRVKVYHLHVFCLAKVESGLTHRFLRSAAAANTEAHTLREREVWFRYRVSDNVSTDGYIHTHKVMLKYLFWQVFW